MALEFSQLLSLYQSEVFQCLLCHSLLYTSRVHISLSVLDTDLRSQQAASESLNKNRIGKFSFFWTLNFVWLFSDRHAQACKMSRHWLVYKRDRWCILEFKRTTQLNLFSFLFLQTRRKRKLWNIWSSVYFLFSFLLVHTSIDDRPWSISRSLESPEIIRIEIKLYFIILNVIRQLIIHSASVKTLFSKTSLSHRQKKKEMMTLLLLLLLLMMMIMMIMMTMIMMMMMMTMMTTH